MKNIYQLEKGQVAMSVSHIYTDDGLVKQILAKLVTVTATILMTKIVYSEFIEYQQTVETSKLFSIIFFGTVLLALIGILYYCFFQRDWRKKIRLTDVKEVTIDMDESNEVEVKVSFLNNRSKSFTFRKLEKEYKRFLQDLKKTSNCAISYETN